LNGGTLNVDIRARRGQPKRPGGVARRRGDGAILATADGPVEVVKIVEGIRELGGAEIGDVADCARGHADIIGALAYVNYQFESALVCPRFAKANVDIIGGVGEWLGCYVLGNGKSADGETGEFQEKRRFHFHRRCSVNHPVNLATGNERLYPESDFGLLF